MKTHMDMMQEELNLNANRRNSLWGKVFVTVSLLVTLLATNVQQAYSISQGQNATMTFTNSSDYTMTVKIIKMGGGLYSQVSLPPHSSRVVGFDHSARYKLKIKAVHQGQTSYHDGGTFYITCDDTGWSQDEMIFKMATYGSGLGPTMSAKEFESNN